MADINNYAVTLSDAVRY